MRYIVIVIILFLTGCTNVSYNQPNNNLEINITSNLSADITVGDNITGNGTETVILWFFRLPGKRFKAEGNVSTLSTSSPANTKIPIISSLLNSINVFNVIENAKGHAIHDALTLSNADGIINPQFTITEDDFFIFKTVKCTVKGKKGTIKSIK